MAHCPKCGFAGAHLLTDGQLRCAGCGTIYQLNLAYPPVPRGGPVAQSKSGMAKLAPFIIFGAVAVIAFAGFFVTMIGGSEPEPHGETPHPRRSGGDVAERPAPEAQVLKAEVGETVIHGMVGTTPWWVISYRNAGTVAIGSPRVRVSLYFENGDHITDVDVSAYVIHLRPGDTAWVFYSASAYKQARTIKYEAVTPMEASKYLPEYFRLAVQDVKVAPHASLPNYADVEGKLYNDTGRKVRVSVLQGIGYDSDGNACAYQIGSPNDFNLDVNGRTTFRLRTGAYNAGTPVRWDVHAWGSFRK